MISQREPIRSATASTGRHARSSVRDVPRNLFLDPRIGSAIETRRSQSGSGRVVREGHSVLNDCDGWNDLVVLLQITSQGESLEHAGIYHTRV